MTITLDGRLLFLASPSGLEAERAQCEATIQEFNQTHAHDQGVDDLLGLSVHLAGTPCSPLYRQHVSPDRELAALVAEHAAR